MSSDGEEVPVLDPIEALRQAGGLLENVQPELLRRLGDLAASAAAGKGAGLLKDLQAATDRVQDALDGIQDALYDAQEVEAEHFYEVVKPIAEITTDSVAPVETVPASQPIESPPQPEPSQEVVDSGAVVQSSEAQAIETAAEPPVVPEVAPEPEPQPALEPELPPEPQPEPAPEPTPAAEHPSEPVEAIEIPEVKGVTVEEKVQAKKAIEFLSQFEDLQSLKNIFSEVFGRSRLPRAQGDRFVQVLDIYTEAGLLRRYGKAFGFRTVAERDAQTESLKQQNIEYDPDFTDYDRSIMEHIKNMPEAKRRELNIGEIVRTFFHVQTLDRPEYLIFITQLNDLADRGYLFHAHGSPWYGLGNRQLPSETPPPEQGDEGVADSQPAGAEQPSATDEAPVTEFTQPAPEPAPELALAGSLDMSTLGLNQRDQQIAELILRTVPTDAWFKQSDIPLGEIGFVSEYAQRQAFGKLASRLVELGVLIDNGKARGGKKYQIADQPAALTVAKSAPEAAQPAKAGEVSKKQAAPAAHARPKPAKSSSPAAPRPKFYEHTQPRSTEANGVAADASPQEIEAHQWRRAAKFALDLQQGTIKLLARRPGERDKLSAMTDEVADTLDVNKTVARKLLSQVVEVGGVYYQSDKGTRFVTTHEPENGGNGKNTQRAVKKAAQAELAILSDNQVKVAVKIIDELLGLQHVQQGELAKTLIAKVKPEDMTEREVRQIIRLLDTRRYVVFDNSGNFGRARKGALVKLRSQDFKTRWKANRESYIEKLKKPDKKQRN